MTTQKQYRCVARKFEDVGGWFICDDSLPYLDTRGTARRNRREAIAAARRMTSREDNGPRFTHYRSGSRIVRL
jgi:hypothetical protein